MPSYLHPNVSGATIFFTVSLARPTSTLLVDEIDRLRDAVRQTRDAHPFGIDAWVVLPNRMHAIWKMPEGDGDFPLRWRLIKSRFSRGLPPHLRHPGQENPKVKSIWQRLNRERHIRDAEDHRVHLRACWFSPCAEGLVENPEDWPFSSIHRDARYTGRRAA